MNSKDTQPGLRLVAEGSNTKPPAADSGNLESKILVHKGPTLSSVPKGSIWAILTVDPAGRLVFSIETEGGSEAQMRTLLEGTLLAHTEVLHQYMDNGRPSVNDLIRPEWRARVTETASPAEPVKT